MSPSTTTRRPVALVTGASSGIGQATARALLDAGYVTYASARRPESLGELTALGAHALRLDTSDESATAAIQTVLEQAGRIDLLVNNAGYGQYGSAEDGEERARRGENLLAVRRGVPALTTPAELRVGEGERRQPQVGGGLCAPGGALVLGHRSLPFLWETDACMIAFVPAVNDGLSA